MSRAVGRVVEIRIRPVWPPFRLGPGWALISGLLGAGALATDAPAVLIARALLAWLLVEVIMGFVWDAWIRGSALRKRTGAHAVNVDPAAAPVGPPPYSLPYSLPGSPWRVSAAWAARKIARWKQDVGEGRRADLSGVFLASLAGIAVSLALGGRVAVLFGLFLAAMALRRLWAARPGRCALVRTLVDFVLPWLVGSLLVKGGGWVGFAPAGLVACYSAAYYSLDRAFGGTEDTEGQSMRLAGASGFVAALWLFALRHPLAGGVVAVLSMPFWLLRPWLWDEDAGGWFLKYVQPFLLLGMVVGALAVAAP